jgi:hypothetical protein
MHALQRGRLQQRDCKRGCEVCACVLQARVGDGLAAVAELAADGQAPKLDVLVVDAGSGDPSLPMSCPPQPFIVRRLLFCIVVLQTP